MSKSTRQLTILVGGMAILALILAAVFPVLAQDDGPTTLQSGDTLGSLFGKFSLTEAQARELLLANSGLQLTAGQTVTFPQDVTVNTGETGAGGDVSATGTPEADSDAGAAAATETPQAGTDNGTAQGTDAFVCSNKGLTGGETYVTQEGDTLGEVAGFFGLTGDVGANPNVTDDQVVEFINLNCELAFIDGQTFTVPAGIPLTGQAGDVDTTQTPLATEATGQVTQTPDADGATTYTIQAGETLADIANQFGITVEQLIELNPDLFPAGTVINVPAQQGNIPQTGNQQAPDLAVSEGLTLGQLIARYNLSQQDLRVFFNANRGLTVAEGQTVQVPQGLTFQGGTDMGDQAAQTPEATADAGADVTQTPEATTDQGGTDQGKQVNSYTTQTGDTLGDILDLLGFDLTMTTANQGDMGGTDQNAQAAQTPEATVEATEMATPEPTTDQGGTGLGTQDGTDAQLQEFVTLNSGLRLNGGQTVTLPSGLASGQGGQIPQTGAPLSPWGGSQDVPGLNLDLDYSGVGSGQVIYVAQNGDSLSSIARRFNIDVAELWALNPSVENPNVIYRGQRLVVPNVGEFLPGSGIFTQDQLDNQFTTPVPSQ